MQANLQDKLIRYLLAVTATTSVVIVLLIFIFLFRESFSFIYEEGITSMLGTKWVPVSFKKELYGIFPLINGTLIVTALAMLIAIPTGIAGAVYLSEMANTKEREILKPFLEILAGIPSVVLGFFGLVVVAPLIKDLFHLSSGLTALTAAVVLALMAAPTIITISEEAIRNVPKAYRQGSYALGANSIDTIIKVVVPAALPGIIAAIMLGTGRIIGETMAVLMVTGNAAIMTWSPFRSVRTMTATIAAEMGEVPFGSMHYSVLFCVGMVLLAMTFVLNVFAQRVLEKYSNRE